MGCRVKKVCNGGYQIRDRWFNDVHYQCGKISEAKKWLRDRAAAMVGKYYLLDDSAGVPEYCSKAKAKKAVENDFAIFELRAVMVV
jgi:hypothetical protein